MWAINYNQLYSLSEQNLLDCVTPSRGCNGGNVAVAYDYVIDEQGGRFVLESSYPYEAKKGECRFKNTAGVTKIVDRGTMIARESTVLIGLWRYGPVAVAIDAGHSSFEFYRTGVYDEPNCSSVSINHGMLLVGWGVTPTAYWLLKNSWGPDWGDKGYIKMVRNKGNQCGVASDAVIPSSFPL
jgi:cathepsin L